MPNNATVTAPLIPVRDLTTYTGSYDASVRLLVTVDNLDTCMMPYDSMANAFIARAAIPDGAGVAGQEGQLAIAPTVVYTYTNGAWGASPRYRTNWSDLTATTRFLLVDRDTQGLSAAEQANGRTNLGIVAASATTAGLAKAGAGLTAASDGTFSVNAATTEQPGSVYIDASDDANKSRSAVSMTLLDSKMDALREYVDGRQIPIASSSQVGGISASNTVHISPDGVATVPDATTASLGVVYLSNGDRSDGKGVVTGAQAASIAENVVSAMVVYASPVQTGIVRIGDGLHVTAQGLLSADEASPRSHITSTDGSYGTVLPTSDITGQEHATSESMVPTVNAVRNYVHDQLTQGNNGVVITSNMLPVAGTTAATRGAVYGSDTVAISENGQLSVHVASGTEVPLTAGLTKLASVPGQLGADANRTAVTIAYLDAWKASALANETRYGFVKTSVDTNDNTAAEKATVPTVKKVTSMLSTVKADVSELQERIDGLVAYSQNEDIALVPTMSTSERGVAKLWTYGSLQDDSTVDRIPLSITNGMLYILRSNLTGTSSGGLLAFDDFQEIITGGKAYLSVKAGACFALGTGTPLYNNPEDIQTTDKAGLHHYEGVILDSAHLAIGNVSFTDSSGGQALAEVIVGNDSSAGRADTSFPFIVRSTQHALSSNVSQQLQTVITPEAISVTAGHLTSSPAAIMQVDGTGMPMVMLNGPHGQPGYLTQVGLKTVYGNRSMYMSLAGDYPIMKMYDPDSYSMTISTTSIQVEKGSKSGNYVFGYDKAAVAGDSDPATTYADNVVTVAMLKVIGQKYFTQTGASQLTVDQVYNPESFNAQSGYAVAQAVGDLSANIVFNADYYSTAVGISATANYDYTTAVGHHATVRDANATAVGSYASAYYHSTAIGSHATASGGSAVVIGSNASASGEGAVVFGVFASAEGVKGIAIGESTHCEGDYSIALGYDVTTKGIYAEAIGYGAQATLGNAAAFGFMAQASASSAIASGSNAKATNSNTAAFGSHSTAGNNYATAVGGYMATARGVHSTAIGYRSNALKNSAVAVGSRANASGIHATALGVKSSATGYESIALGANTTASASHATAIGSHATASGLSASAFGDHSTASALRSLAVGCHATASNEFASAIGYWAKCSGYAAIAIGGDAKASQNSATALGRNANASGYSATALGYLASASGGNATAIGNHATASKYAAIAIGLQAAAGDSATAIGDNASASGDWATALGSHATASEHNATALGNGASAGGYNATALGCNANASGHSTALGYNAQAISSSTALGTHATASGSEATALGSKATASKYAANALGCWAQANGNYATAVGASALASGNYATAVGAGASASDYATALGNGASASNFATALGRGASASGTAATAVGAEASASGSNATAIGNHATASGYNATALGILAKASSYATALGGGTSASTYATAIGNEARASGYHATALGNEASAINSSSTALGSSTYASGISATAVGCHARANSTAATALGVHATASGATATALGVHATASGVAATALGSSTTASGNNATAVGNGASASGSNATALGNGASANSHYATALGSGASASYHATALGTGATASGSSSIQLGAGTNSNDDIFQVWDYTLLDRTTGKIPADRLPSGIGGGGGGGSIEGIELTSENTVVGVNASAGGSSSTALGYEASASGSHATAIGSGASAIGANATALGYEASASGYGTALGYEASASGYGTALGHSAKATGGAATALGYGASANNTQATALGYNAKANKEQATALGYNANASDGATALGSGCHTIMTHSAAMRASSARALHFWIDSSGNVWLGTTSLNGQTRYKKINLTTALASAWQNWS